jgi:hypothetical protein
MTKWMSKWSGAGFKAVLSLVVSLFVFSLYGQESPQSQIEKYFRGLERTVIELTNKPQIKSRRLKNADKLFVSTIKKYPFFHTLMRVNSKGKVVNEVVEGKVQSKNYRSIARQSWYRDIEKTMKPYFGHLTRHGTPYWLFWVVPIKIPTKGGSVRFGGAIVTKIDIENCMNDIASALEQPFAVRIDGEQVFSANWKKATESTEQKLSIKGLENVTLHTAAQNAAGSSKTANSKSTESQQQGKQAGDTANAKKGVEAITELIGVKDTTTQKKIGRYVTALVTPLIIIAVAIIAFLIVNSIQKKLKRQHEELMAELEGKGGEQSGKRVPSAQTHQNRSPTPPPDRAPPSGIQHSPPQQEYSVEPQYSPPPQQPVQRPPSEQSFAQTAPYYQETDQDADTIRNEKSSKVNEYTGPTHQRPIDRMDSSGIDVEQLRSEIYQEIRREVGATLHPMLSEIVQSVNNLSETIEKLDAHTASITNRLRSDADQLKNTLQNFEQKMK